MSSFPSHRVEQPGGVSAEERPQSAPTFRVYCGDDAPRETVCTFAETWYIPTRLEGRKRSQKTIAELRTALRYWADLMGDPPIESLSSTLCAEFVRRLEGQRGRKGEKLARNTVCKHCRSLQIVLDHAGPAGQHCRRPAEPRGLFGADEAGWPRPAPLFPEMEREKTAPKASLSFSQMHDLLKATSHAVQPAIDECRASDWWSALYRFLFWSGLRIGSALFARREWIHRSSKLVWMEIPKEYYKGGRPEFLWLHPRALAAIESIATTNGIFPWPHSFPKHLETVHKRNLKAAGILPLADFAFHTFRRRTASAVACTKREAAGLLLRHQGGVTRDSYLEIESLVQGQKATLKPIMDQIAKRNPWL